METRLNTAVLGCVGDATQCSSLLGLVSVIGLAFSKLVPLAVRGAAVRLIAVLVARSLEKRCLGTQLLQRQR